MTEVTETNSDLAKAAQILYVTKENTLFEETSGHMLDCFVNGEHHQSVFLHCSFPHTDQRIYISVRKIDNEEIGMIKHLEDFSQDTIQLLEKHIHLRYFAPEIQRLNRIKEEFGYSYWDVETTAGRCYFTVRNGSGSVAMITTKQVLVTDVDGNRFMIKDIAHLTEKEYRMVEMLFI